MFHPGPSGRDMDPRRVTTVPVAGRELAPPAPGDARHRTPKNRAASTRSRASDAASRYFLLVVRVRPLAGACTCQCAFMCAQLRAVWCARILSTWGTLADHECRRAYARACGACGPKACQSLRAASEIPSRIPVGRSIWRGFPVTLKNKNRQSPVKARHFPAETHYMRSQLYNALQVLTNPFCGG